jgi:hypothetical protein
MVTSQSLDQKTLLKIWTAADSRTKTWICLSLNAGYNQSDIATLRAEHIVDGCAVRPRQKTAVRYRHKLWSVTKALIAKNVSVNGAGLLFEGEANSPGLHVTASGTGESGSIHSQLNRLCEQLGIKGVTFSSFRDSSATQVARFAPELIDTFLGRVDNRLARPDIDQKGETNNRLDTVIDHLEQHFALGLN